MCVYGCVLCTYTPLLHHVVLLLAVLWTVELLGSIILHLNTAYFLHSPAYFSSEYKK